MTTLLVQYIGRKQSILKDPTYILRFEKWIQQLVGSNRELRYTVLGKCISPNVIVTDDWTWITANLTVERANRPFCILVNRPSTVDTQTSLVHSKGQVLDQLVAPIDVVLDDPTGTLAQSKMVHHWTSVYDPVSTACQQLWTNHHQHLTNRQILDNVNVWLASRNYKMARLEFDSLQNDLIDWIRSDHKQTYPSVGATDQPSALALSWIQTHLNCAIAYWSESVQLQLTKLCIPTAYWMSIHTSDAECTSWLAIYLELCELTYGRYKWNRVPRGMNARDPWWHRSPHVWMLNLDRRKDRWHRMTRTHPFVRRHGVRVRAIDGLAQTALLNELARFYHVQFDSRKLREGHIACLMGHVLMWEHLLDVLIDDRDYCLILEDDITFGAVFDRDWPVLQHWLSGQRTWDLLWIGWHQWPAERGENMLDLRPASSTVELVTRFPLVWKIGGTFAYVVNRRGARRLLEAWSHVRYLDVGVDTWMMHLPASSLVQFACRRPLIWSSIVADTDIQLPRLQ